MHYFIGVEHSAFWKQTKNDQIHFLHKQNIIAHRFIELFQIRKEPNSDLEIGHRFRKSFGKQ